MPIPTDHPTAQPADSLRLDLPHHPRALGIDAIEALHEAYVGAYIDIYRPPTPAEIADGADPEQPLGASGLVEDVTLAGGVPGVVVDYGYELQIAPDVLVRARRGSHSHDYPLPPECPLSEPGASRPAPRPLPDALRPVAAQVLANLTGSGGLFLSPERASELADFFDLLVRMADPEDRLGVGDRRSALLDEIVARASDVRDALGIDGEA